MGLIIGPTPWWQASLVAQCPVGTPLIDGSRIICKSGGTAWIIAPACTQVASAWAGGQYNSSVCGNRCCISEWSGLNTQLLNCGFNPCDWFVPNITQLNNPGYLCRSQWDTFSGTCYWSSSEFSATNAYLMGFGSSFPGVLADCQKTVACSVRAMRCVTY